MMFFYIPAILLCCGHAAIAGSASPATNSHKVANGPAQRLRKEHNNIQSNIKPIVGGNNLQILRTGAGVIVPLIGVGTLITMIVQGKRSRIRETVMEEQRRKETTKSHELLKQIKELLISSKTESEAIIQDINASTSQSSILTDLVKDMSDICDQNRQDTNSEKQHLEQKLAAVNLENGLIKASLNEKNRKLRKRSASLMDLEKQSADLVDAVKAVLATPLHVDKSSAVSHQDN